ncbi:MAG: hypothetical protein GX493_11070 [Firmicutes bacterium]|nr:hypothetical protein [Bacillota bacterium]
MAVSTDVTLASVLGTLTGTTNVSTVTTSGTTVTGTLSVVGLDVLIYSPNTAGTNSVIVPFNAIDHVIAP